MAWETEIPDVVAGQPIEAAWGNKIRNQVVHVVATVAALPVVPDGGVAYVEADDKLYLRRVGAWVPAGPGGRVAYAEKTAGQTALSSQTDLTGLSVTFTAILGRSYRLTTGGLFARNGASTPTHALMQIKHSSGSPVYKEVQIHTPSNGYALNGEGSIVKTDLTGALTLKVSAGGSGGAVDLGGSPTNPSFLLVEDLGV